MSLFRVLSVWSSLQFNKKTVTFLYLLLEVSCFRDCQTGVPSWPACSPFKRPSCSYGLSH